MLDNYSKIPLFQNLNPQQASLFLTAFEHYNCPAETTLFDQGETADFLYIILKGKAVIRYKPYDGPALVLTRLKSGDVFGWSAVVGSQKYSSSVISETDMETIRLHRKSLWEIINKYPEIGRIIIDRLARNVSPRWENAHEQIKSLLSSGRKSK